MEHKFGCIYLITCLENNKRYVGKTSKPSPTSRFKRHLCSVRTQDRNYPLYNDMRKYGIDKFKIETLCIVPIESLDNMEEYWAEQLETYIWDNPGGYNLVWCGKYSRLGISHTQESRKKITNIQTNRKLSDYHKDQIKISLNKPETKIKLHLRNLGRSASLEACKHISESLKGHIVSDETKNKIGEANRKNFSDFEKRKQMSYIKRNPNITLESADNIRELYKNTKHTHKSLSLLFEISETTVRRIVNMQRYVY
jgi:group I intron endonuclease